MVTIHLKRNIDMAQQNFDFPPPSPVAVDVCVSGGKTGLIIVKSAFKLEAGLPNLVGTASKL